MDWDPHSEMFQEQENNINEHHTGDYNISAHQRQIMSVQRNDMHFISTAYDDSHTLSQLQVPLLLILNIKLPQNVFHPYGI
jgi:hypothetical protein